MVQVMLYKGLLTYGLRVVAPSMASIELAYKNTPNVSLYCMSD